MLTILYACLFLLQDRESEPALSQLVPANSFFYLEIKPFKSFRKQIDEHALWQHFEKSSLHMAWEQHATKRKLEGLKKAFELATQQKLGNVLETITAQGAAFALMPSAQLKKPDLILLLRGQDQGLNRRLIESISTLVLAANNKAQWQKDEESDEPWLEVPQQFALSMRGEILGFSTRPELLKQALRNHKDKSQISIESKSGFLEAKKSQSYFGFAWAYLDLAALRELLPNSQKFPEKADNPLGALWVGGILEALNASSYLSGSLALDTKSIISQLQLSAKLSNDSPFFVRRKIQKGQFSNPPETIARYFLNRDLLKFWMAKENYVREDDLAKLAEFQSNFGILFGGKKLDSEFLPEMGQEVEIFVTRQDIKEWKQFPAQIFPGVAAVFQLKNPEQMASSWEMAFQTTIGIANTQRAQQGRPGFLLGQETVNGVKVSVAQYAQMTANPNSNDRNVSPAMALIGNRLILGSSISTVRDLIKSYQPESSPMVLGVEGTDLWENEGFWIAAAPLESMLRENEASLVASKMLNKMQDKATATQETRRLLEVLGWFQVFSVAQHVQDGKLKFLVQLSAK